MIQSASLFKIWNKTLQRYDDPTDYAVRCDMYALSYDWTSDSERARAWGPVYDEYVVQLFSGLFDIDGNPIYEGDLIANPSEKHHDVYFIYEVGTYCGSYCKPYIYKAFSNSTCVHVVGRVNCEGSLDFSKLRLIGNIHSTPLNIHK